MLCFAGPHTSSLIVAMSHRTRTFRTEFTQEQRLSESRRIREKYPDRVPIIVERDERSSDVPMIDKKKYLVPSDLTCGQFNYVIRKRLKLKPERAMFLFINNTLPPTGSLVSSIYSTDKHDDGYLYVTYSGENTFGCRLPVNSNPPFAPLFDRTNGVRTSTEPATYGYVYT